MTKRCRHELEKKDGYPDDIICLLCQTSWTITHYMDYTAKELMNHCPFEVRQAVLKRQAEKFAKANPEHYHEGGIYGETIY